jgi:exonuclease 3'-5' domain-containing protein 1
MCDTSHVTLINSLSVLNHFKTVVEGVKLIAIDAEGVDLSRLGKLTVFSVGVHVTNGVHIFLFDVIASDEELLQEQSVVLKGLMEDTRMTKIIHDCRQDSDALQHQFKISLCGVFDSSVYAMKLRNTSKRSNLNKTLKDFRCTLNEHRDEISSLYKQNPSVWRRRPLTPCLVG